VTADCRVPSQPGTYLDQNTREIPIRDFINKELILFSMADNVRSIPSVVDGFKPGQRKVLFGCFKRNLKSEAKVAQLVGYISEVTAYHHGEASLAGTIVGMAQHFVGNNNINPLMPNGQFGTRLQGGKDHASPRYIFTSLCPITRKIFRKEDDEVLAYLNDDGQSIEPMWYMPILPMVLVNGSDGIGTGWSSAIPTYNPSEIVANIRRKMEGKELLPMHPWFRGFKGTVQDLGAGRYNTCGIACMTSDDTVEIFELPVRTWTNTYVEQLLAWSQATDKQPAIVKVSWRV
jgi:DNA topoisomerase-2